MILVGVDGSDSARAALGWALAEAQARGERVRLVTVWETHVYAYAPGFVPPVTPEFDDSFERAAKDAVDETLAALGDDVAGLEIERRIVRGAAAEVLVTEAADADLLVVGSRGHGGFAGLLLGSVSQACAQHAPCPVVIVRAGVATAAAALGTRVPQRP